MLAKNPNLVILDVRSPGEYDDTSKYRTLNLGGINGDINFPIDSMKIHFGRLTECIQELSKKMKLFACGLLVLYPPLLH